MRVRQLGHTNITSLNVLQHSGIAANMGWRKHRPTAETTAHPPTVCFSLGITNRWQPSQRTGKVVTVELDKGVVSTGGAEP